MTAPLRAAARAVDAATVALLAVIASAASLANAFTGDDHWIIERNDRVHHLGVAWRLFAQTYWPPQNGAALYRPIPMLGFAVEWAIGNGSPRVFHAAGVLLYASVAIALWWLVSALLSRRAAWIAAAAFAAHPVHADVTAQVVGQSELWCALWTILGLALYFRWRPVDPTNAPTRMSTTQWSWFHLGVLAVVYTAACLSKENGIVLPLLIAAAEAVGVRDERTWWVRLRIATRPLVVLTLVAIAYLGVRRAVVGSLAGDYPTFVFAHASASTRALTMLGAFPLVLRLLVWPTHIAVEYMPQAIRIYTHWDPRLIPCAVLLFALGALAASRRRVGPVIAWAIAWTGIALLPVSNLLIPAGVVLAPRTLFLPSVGAVIAVVASCELLTRWATARWPTLAVPRWRQATVGFAVGIVCVGLAGSIERTLAWHDDLTLVLQTVLDAPRSYLARDAYGRALFELGHPADGERELRRAIALYPDDPGPYAHLAAAYVAAGLCEPAIPLYRQALAILPTRPDARAGLARCLGH